MAPGQEAPRPRCQSPARQFASRTELVEVYATVTDRKGRLVTDLGRDEFTVLEDGVRAADLDLRRRRTARVDCPGRGPQLEHGERSAGGRPARRPGPAARAGRPGPGDARRDRVRGGGARAADRRPRRRGRGPAGARPVGIHCAPRRRGHGVRCHRACARPPCPGAGVRRARAQQSPVVRQTCSPASAPATCWPIPSSCSGTCRPSSSSSLPRRAGGRSGWGGWETCRRSCGASRRNSGTSTSSATNRCGRRRRGSIGTFRSVCRGPEHQVRARAGYLAR